MHFFPPPETPSDCDTAAQFGSRYYTLVDQPREYAEAEYICRMMLGHVASITSPEQNNFVTTYIEQNGYVLVLIFIYLYVCQSACNVCLYVTSVCVYICTNNYQLTTHTLISA